MQISDSMLERFCQRYPAFAPGTIRAMLENLTEGGQLVFHAERGTSGSPTLLQLLIDDPLEAVQLAQQLLGGAERALQGQTERSGVRLLLAGKALVSE